MGWLDYHLHLFRVSERAGGQVVQIGIPDDDALRVTSRFCPAGTFPSQRTSPARVLLPSTNTTLAMAGNTRSPLRRLRRARKAGGTPSVSGASARVRRRTVVVSADMRIFWR